MVGSRLLGKPGGSTHDQHCISDTASLFEGDFDGISIGKWNLLDGYRISFCNQR